MLVAPRLPQEEVAGRVIRAVNLRVALDAGASRDAVAARVHLGLVVDRRRVAARNMAALAQHRQLGDQQPLVVRSVRVVTGDAALAGHLVIPQERTALLGVAGRARFVDGVAFTQHLHVLRPVRIVAGRALHLVTVQAPDRHVRRALHLVHLGPVALHAGFLHGLGLQLLLPLGGVHAVAGHAREVAGVVLAAGPVVVTGAVVARQADVAGLARGQRLGVRNLGLVPSTVDVRLARAMTALTAFTRRRCARVRRARMRTAVVALLLVLVARQTGVLADVTGYRGGGRGRCLGSLHLRGAVLARAGRSRDGDHDRDPESDRGGDGSEGAREAAHRSSLV